MAEDATYWFTAGSHVGREAIREALARTWQAIRDETYEIRDLEVVVEQRDLALFRYRFLWSGVVEGRGGARHQRRRTPRRSMADAA